MPRVLANDGIDPIGKKMLEDAGFEVVTEKVAQEDLVNELKNYDAVTVRSATKIRKDLIDACPNIKLIGRGGVGMDNIDVEYARSKGVQVENTPAASSVSVAELTFAHLLSCTRKLTQSNRQMPTEGMAKFGEIKKSSKGTEIQGKTMGIIGLGRIGQEAAKIALGLGMNLLTFDPYVKNVDLTLSIGGQNVTVPVTPVSKEELIANSDFIALHVPFNAGDAPIIGEAEINNMKDGAGIINCARGGAVSEKALLAGLESGKIAFAGLDVFENEPPVDDTILKHPKVSLSAHVGGSTDEAQVKIGSELAEKIITFFKAQNATA